MSTQLTTRAGTGPHLRWICRRATHSSRAAASVITAALLIAVLVWLGTETVLSAAGAPALLASPVQMVRWLAGIPENTLPALLVGAGAVLALVGLLLVLLGLLPGARARHIIASDRSAIVVDDGVIAAALSRAACRTAGLTPEQVTTLVRRDSVQLTIRPTSGIPLDEEAIGEAVRHELSAYGLRPEPEVQIRISDRGAVGV
jgi:hypothetical protein